MIRFASWLRCGAPTLAFALAACGGGSGGGVVSAGNPPAPPATYTKIADLTGNRTFQTGGVTYHSDPLRLSSGTTQQFGTGVTVAYDAAADSYTMTAPTGSLVIVGTSMTQTFGPADLQPASPSLPNGVTYIKSNGTIREQLTLIAPGGSVPLSYTVFGTWSRVNLTDNGLSIANTGTVRTMVGGSPTLASDMPKTGSANYTIGVGGTAIVTRAPGSDLGAPFPPSSPGPGTGGAVTISDVLVSPPGPVTTTYALSGNSSGTFSANFASGAINTTLTLAGTVVGSAAAPVNFGTFTGTGTLTSGGPGYTGTLIGTPADGIFSGAFFGPQALETAFGYFLSGTKFSAAGGASGTKQ